MVVENIYEIIGYKNVRTTIQPEVDLLNLSRLVMALSSVDLLNTLTTKTSDRFSRFFDI
jgi:hypothetical protein